MNVKWKKRSSGEKHGKVGDYMGTEISTQIVSICAFLFLSGINS